MTKAVNTSVRLTVALLDRLDVIAERNGLDRSEVIRRFLQSGIAANPVTDAELRALHSRRSQMRTGEVPGLVIPLPPADLVAKQESGTDQEVGEWRGGRPTPPYVWSDASVLLTDKKHNTRKHLRAA